jgi:hypothetical protein
MLKTIFVLALLSNVCAAEIVLTVDELDINWSGFGSTGSGGKATRTSLTSTLTGNQLSATACYDPYCTAEQHGTIIVNEPLTLRVTDFSFACANTAGLFCGQENITFDYLFIFRDSPEGTTVPVFLSLDGTGPADYAFFHGGGDYSFRLFASVGFDVSFDQRFTLSQSGAFGGTFFLGDFTYGPNGPLSIYQAVFFLIVPPIQDPQPIVIRNMTLTLGNPSGGPQAVPEPGTLSLVGLAIGALGLLRRRC